MLIDQWNFDLDVVVADPVDFHARIACFGDLEVVWVRFVTDAICGLGGDDRALSAPWRHRVHIEFKQLGMPGHGRIDQSLGVILR